MIQKMYQKWMLIGSSNLGKKSFWGFTGTLFCITEKVSSKEKVSIIIHFKVIE